MRDEPRQAAHLSSHGVTGWARFRGLRWRGHRDRPADDIGGDVRAPGTTPGSMAGSMVVRRQPGRPRGCTHPRQRSRSRSHRRRNRTCRRAATRWCCRLAHTMVRSVLTLFRVTVIRLDVDRRTIGSWPLPARTARLRRHRVTAASTPQRRAGSLDFITAVSSKVRCTGSAVSSAAPGRRSHRWSGSRRRVPARRGSPTRRSASRSRRTRRTT